MLPSVYFFFWFGAQLYMQAFLLFYFIPWFYVFVVGVGGLGQDPSALEEILLLTSHANATCIASIEK